MAPFELPGPVELVVLIALVLHIVWLTTRVKALDRRAAELEGRLGPRGSEANKANDP